MRLQTLIIVAVLLLVHASTYALDGFPAFPMAFWGTVTTNGTAAPVGSVVRAYYGSTLVGTATVQETGIYGYTEPTKQKLIVAEGTGVITFKIQASGFNSGSETTGDTTITQDAFTSGLTVQKNLGFTITPPSTGGSGGGGGSSSGGGGGGGGGTPAPTPTTSTSAKGDATGDGKVDVLDFNSLLIQWGKSGTNLTADLDKNGSVDIFDFNLLLINWSK